MDELTRVFEAQKEFESLFVDFERLNSGELGYVDELIQYFIHCLNREAYEILDEFNWKKHKDPKFHDTFKITEEVVDAFTFLINICLVCNISPQDLINGYFLKNKINWERQNGRLKKP